MAGYGTAKTQTTNLNLGFPTAYGKAYARFGSPEMFAPERPLMPLNNTEGMDFQALWHQQKMRDAHYMAGAKVRSTHTMNARGFSSPHGYFNLPPPVLGQRHFANPSFGSYPSGNPARQDQPGSPWYITSGQFSGSGAMCDERLVGGVLRTSAGQRHGKATLDARIAQLNAIEAAKQNFFAEGNDHTLQTERTPFAGAEPSMDALLGATPLVELAQVLQSIKDNIYASDYKATGRDTLQDFSKIFPLIVRMASNNTASDIANVLEFIEGTSAEDGIIQLLNTKIETIQEAGFDASSDTKEIAYFNRLTVQLEWWQKVCNYLKKMLEIAEAPAKTRQNASQAYIKSFGFARLSRDIGTTYRTNIVPEDTFIDTTGHVNNPQNAQRAVDGQARSGRSGAFINPYASVFTKQAPTREDSQHGYTGDGGAEYSKNAQEAYAFGSGEYQDNTGGRPRAWLGEEELAEYGEQPTMEAVAEEQIGKEAEEEEDEEEVPLWPQEGLSMSSKKDPITGEFNVETQAKPPTKFQMRGEPGPSKQKQYKESDVPRDVPGLRAFIQRLNKDHGYSQAIYKKAGADPKASNVRKHTIAKMKSLGLL